MRSFLLKTTTALFAPRSSAGSSLRNWSTLARTSRLTVASSSQVISPGLEHNYSTGRPRITFIQKSFDLMPRRFYSPTEPNAANVEDVRKRVLKVCAAFDKINADKLTVDSHFMNDLGLDSLDHVEVIMAIEDEFGFEIPDAHAEKLLKPADIVQYVVEKKENQD